MTSLQFVVEYFVYILIRSLLKTSFSIYKKVRPFDLKRGFSFLYNMKKIFRTS